MGLPNYISASNLMYEASELTQVGTIRQRVWHSMTRKTWTYTISVNLQLDGVVNSVEGNSMQQRSDSSVCVFPVGSAYNRYDGADNLPVGRSSSGDSLFIGNDGFVEVLLAQNTGLLVSLDSVGTVLQLYAMQMISSLRDGIDIDVTTNVSRQVTCRVSFIGRQRDASLQM